jgi:hypothetical protein
MRVLPSLPFVECWRKLLTLLVEALNERTFGTHDVSCAASFRPESDSESNRCRVWPGGGFKVLRDHQNHSAGQPESGKALVYLIQDDTQFLSWPRPTTRVGIDGTWVGATQSKSYFYVSVEPGEHRVCASWQSFVGADVAHSTAAVHLTAVAAHTYYFVVRNSYQSQP